MATVSEARDAVNREWGGPVKGDMEKITAGQALYTLEKRGILAPDPKPKLDPEYLDKMSVLDLLQSAIENLQTMLHQPSVGRVQFVEAQITECWRRLSGEITFTR